MEKEDGDEDQKEEEIKIIFSSLKKDPENDLETNTEGYKRDNSHCVFEDISSKKEGKVFLFFLFLSFLFHGVFQLTMQEMQKLITCNSKKHRISKVVNVRTCDLSRKLLFEKYLAHPGHVVGIKPASFCSILRSKVIHPAHGADECNICSEYKEKKKSGTLSACVDACTYTYIFIYI
jgi:hypothetical protein